MAEMNHSSFVWLKRTVLAAVLLVYLAGVQDGYSQESPHGKIRFECSTCHTTDTWKISKSSFKHDVTGFELTGRHATLRCESCHEGLKFTKQSSNCLSCHTDIHKSELGTNCLRCHTTKTWNITDMVQKHQSTRFPLLGRHSTLSCQTCHANAGQKQFSGTSTDCFSCHRNDFARAKAPNHAAAGFSTNCVQCHQVTAFKWGTGFDHVQTAFPLTGAHVATSCFSCHKNQVFTSTPTQCVACHQADFTSTRNPNHPTARFSTECQSCHTTTAWAGAQFNHDQTRFPLIGAHRAQDCQSCHADNVFIGKATDCVSCHRADYNRVTNPNHVTGNFPTNCTLCHTQTSYRPATFNHSSSSFPLTGAHQAVACSQCHINGQYTNTPSTCIGCHQTIFTATTNPNHVQRNFSTNCVQCHTTAGWHPAQFDHATTQFPLTGRHTSTQCQDCHTGNNYQLTYTDCFQCHQSQYAQPTNPRHVEVSFSHNCVPCHTTSVWRPSTFSHSTTRFPLTGRHINTTCNQCHINNIYRNLPATCWDCHQNNFNTTTGPNHVQRNLSHDCTQCHSTNGWDGAAFDHNTTNFPLTGAHIATQCQQCHVSGNYQLVYTNCFPCHQTQYDLPTNPRHVLPSFAHECTPCHNTTVWRPSTFSHATTPFPLVGAHQSVTCNQCHVNNQYQMPYTCWDCHATNFNATTNPNHQQGQFSHDCVSCHTQNGWQPATFNHATTNFPLTGAHVATQCQQCHTNNNYQLTYTDCFQCHQTQYAQPTNPTHVVVSFSHNCVPCHTTSVWRPSTFSHSTTRFPLTGRHITATCNQCHINNVYRNLPATCWDCHQNNFNTTTDPNHVQRNFSHDCTQCHSTNGWDGAAFDHNTTNFPLTGAHIATQCQQCHVNGNYQLVYTNCYPCHTTRFAQPQNPNHVLGNFNHDCAPCHTTTVWRPSTFSHATTPFPLIGAHQSVTCNQCHVNNQYQMPYTCWDCHATNFNTTTNPNHQQGQFSHDCLTCHTQSGWQPATFNHATTNFPLTGAHVATQCQACHVNGNYQLVYTNCYPCHTTRFAQPQNPNHVLGNFNHDCAPCHTTTVWRPSTFSHATTPFPLIGAHQSVTCNQCHVNNLYQLPHTCWDCHATNFNATTNPSHQQGQFSHDCLTCHTQSGWQPATFNHATTNFPLTGAHVATQCQQCHVNGNYQLVYTNCFPCHQTQYNLPVSPRHVLPSFAYQCTPCHTTTAWTPSTFSHANTNFPLTGAHQATACNQCHVNNIYQGTPRTCIGCHQTDFNATTNPNHVARNFSQNCVDCHATTAWSPASFNHSTSNFPLTGRHTTSTCVSCHVNNNYNLVYNDCYQCHSADFARPSNPNHVSQIFPHNCTMCHNTTVWTPNTMNHDAAWFRIYSGNHRNRWTQCSQCHTTLGNLAAFSCTTGCHQNAHHQTQNCYSCHRNA